MAETLVTKSAKASIDGSSGMVNAQIAGLLAGENIAALDLVYIKNDGTVWRATAAALNAAAHAIGISPRDANAGEPVTIFTGPGIQARYGDDSTFTPGAVLYLAETAGGLSTTPTTGDASGVAQATDDQNIRLITGFAGAIAGIGGAGAGYKVARGVHQQAAASDTVATGLATVVAVVVSWQDGPTVKQMFLGASIGDQAGAPVAGSFLLKTFKPTAVNDVTPIAATDFTDNLKINWVAIGT